MTTHQLKLDMIQTILEIKEPALLKKAAKTLQGLLESTTANGNGHVEEEEFDATEMSFEEWNKQFTNSQPLDEYIPEHGMTLGEFRKKIYEAERSDYMTEEEFMSQLNTMRNDLKKKYAL